MLRIIRTAALAAGLFVCTALGLTVTTVSSAEAASLSCVPSDLKQTLSQIQSQFGPVRVISTFRKGARIAGSGKPSYHASCRAVDFYPPPGKHAQVVSWLRSNHRGGVGTYSCGAGHIHIDNGPAYRWHKCTGGKGRKHARSRGAKRAG
jgi:uncharacterized protein YcbK (DUF882 family)